MKNKTPLVSVLMTVYNARSFLHGAIESVLNQTYSNLELIIVDDGSTDGSDKIIKDFAKGDKRIKTLFLKSNVGPSHASNRGLKITEGAYIARMDADDIALPNRIERQVNYLLKNPDVVLLGGQCVLINEKGNEIGKKIFPIKHQDIYKSLFKINPIQHPSCMINTNLVPRGHKYYKNSFILAHDLELVFDLARFGRLTNLKSVVLKYRQYPTSLSLRNPKDTFKATLRVRNKAVKNYGYKPDLLGRLTNLLQRVVIFFLPSEVIYPIFRLIRVSDKKDIQNAFGDIKHFVINKFIQRTENIRSKLAFEFK